MHINKRVCILFGGTSEEASVSLDSAKYILNNIDKSKYETIVVFLDKDYSFYLLKIDLNTIKSISEITKQNKINFVNSHIVTIPKLEKKAEIDVIFSIVHGQIGEDGVLQGFFKIQQIPYCGSDFYSSSLSINKYLTKIFLEKEGVPACKSMFVRDITNISVKNIKSTIGFPLIIKPTSLGSSIGVFKIHDEEELGVFLSKTYEYSKSLMIEEYVECRELECSLIETEDGIFSSDIGEIRKTFDVYSFDEKYINNNVEFLIPSKIDYETKQIIKKLSEKIFTLLNCSGFARVDFFLTKKGEIFFNEINTLPGFTKISMFPKLLEYKDFTPSQIIDLIINKSLWQT